MSALSVSESNSLRDWAKQPGIEKSINGLAQPGSKKEAVFNSDFPSPADDSGNRKELKTEAGKSVGKGKPFSYTSENWLG